MKGSFHFEKFLYTYLIFLAFFTFVIGLGADSFFTDENAQLITAANLDDGSSYVQTNTTYSDAYELAVETGGLSGISAAITGFLTHIREWFVGATTLDVAAWMDTSFGPFAHFFQNIYLFIRMASSDFGTGAIAALVFTPAVTYLIYGILKLLSPGGG